MSNLRLTAYSSFFNYIFTTVSQRFSNCVWRAFYFRDHYVFGRKLRNQSQIQSEDLFAARWL